MSGASSKTDLATGTITVWTVGHSTQSADSLVALLRSVGVELLVDVRTVPRSRHNPQFDRSVLPSTLAEAGLDYLHVKELGGLRKPRPDSPNRGWRNTSFQAYADHMGSDEFSRGLERLLELARQRKLALMCAEAVPWRCHRSLIADALTVRDVEVIHLLPGGRQERHQLTSFARVEGTRISYPPQQQELLPEDRR